MATTVASSGRKGRLPAAQRADLIGISGVAVLLLAFFLEPVWVHSMRFGTGPDFSVYLWWTRLGSAQGLTTIGERPAAPGLISIIGGSTGMSLVQSVAGLQFALGPIIGLAAVALIRGRQWAGRLGWWLGAAMCGMFAIHLGSGYIANLTLLPLFLISAALIASVAEATRPTRVAAGGALVCMTAASLTHPQFFILSAAILLGAALLHGLIEKDLGRWQPLRATLIAVAGAAIVLSASFIGRTGHNADTSQDAAYRRLGLTDQLRDAFRDRFSEKLPNYTPWLLALLGALGIRQTRGFARRFALIWMGATLLGVAFALVTRLFPPERLLTFAFPFAMLAGLTLAWLASSPTGFGYGFAGKALAWALVAAALALMSVTWIRTTNRQTAFITTELVSQMNEAAKLPRQADQTWVFVVDQEKPDIGFQATRAQNLLRATLPAEAIPHSFVYVGTPENLDAERPTLVGDVAHDLLSRDTLERIPDGPKLVLILDSLATAEADQPPAGRDVIQRPGLVAFRSGQTAEANAAAGSSVLRPTEPSSPLGLTLATLITLVVLSVAGFGWSRWMFREDLVTALCAAPTAAIAVLSLAAVAVDRSGVMVTGRVVPALLLGLGGGLGYVMWVRARRAHQDVFLP